MALGRAFHNLGAATEKALSLLFITPERSSGFLESPWRIIKFLTSVQERFEMRFLHSFDIWLPARFASVPLSTFKRLMQNCSHICQLTSLVQRRRRRPNFIAAAILPPDITYVAIHNTWTSCDGRRQVLLTFRYLVDITGSYWSLFLTLFKRSETRRTDMINISQIGGLKWLLST